MAGPASFFLGGGMGCKTFFRGARSSTSPWLWPLQGGKTIKTSSVLTQYMKMLTFFLAGPFFSWFHRKFGGKLGARQNWGRSIYPPPPFAPPGRRHWISQCQKSWFYNYSQRVCRKFYMIQGIRKRPMYRFEDTIVWERWHFLTSGINIDYHLIQYIRGFC